MEQFIFIQNAQDKLKPEREVQVVEGQHLYIKTQDDYLVSTEWVGFKNYCLKFKITFKEPRKNLGSFYL